MLQRFLIVWLCLLSAVALWWPADQMDPFVASAAWLPLVIVLTMFAVGSLLPRDELRQVVARWPTVLSGTVVQYASMPLLAWSIAHLFGLPPAYRIGLIMVGCVPGAMASNVLTLLGRGNVSYSVSLTTSATLLSPLFVPLVLKITLGKQLPTSLLSLVWRLAWMVVIPVLAGHLLARSWSRFAQFARCSGQAIASVAILWIIAVVVGLNRERLAEMDGRILAAVLALNGCGYTAGMVGGFALRLPVPMQRALTLEVGMQNAGLGTALAAQIFAGQESVLIPTALYTFGCMLTGTMLAHWWRQQDGAREGEKSSA